VYEWLGGFEQPTQRFTELCGIEFGVEVAFDISDRALEHVEPIAQRFELGACEHQLVFAQPELGGAMTSLVVPLPAALAAVLPGPASRRCRR
jgi:hypothetical protein